MRKSISFYLLPVLLTVLCLSSCSETGQKTEYTHVIPANATEVAALDLKSIVDKAGLNTSDSRGTLQKFLGLLLEGGSANLKQEAETLLKDPAESGIDWNAPLYVFEAPTLHNTAITLKIADLKKFEAMLRLLAQEQLCTAPVEAGGYRSVEIKDAGILLAYNDGTLLGVYGGSTEQLKKLQPAITALMQQPADKSIRTGKYFTLMMQQKGDIRLLATPDALPMDVRGVLTWPHGTQLLGYVLFENGRIYATLQNADFKGNTTPSKFAGAATGHAEHDARTSLQHFIDQQRIAYFKQPAGAYGICSERTGSQHPLSTDYENRRAEPAGRQEPDQLYGRSERKERERPETAYRLCQVVHRDVTGSRHSAIHIQHAMRNL